jgi:hypothetical protein
MKWREGGKTQCEYASAHVNSFKKTYAEITRKCFAGKEILRRGWDTLLLYRITENLLHWAVKYFRPLVSDDLGRWYLVKKEASFFGRHQIVLENGNGKYRTRKRPAMSTTKQVFLIRTRH